MLKPLLPEQLRAADPAVSAWVSASAGTGKTQVLAARVLRLLLAGARPERLLALTFTKAAAAEMQTRIFETLAGWVRAGDATLDAELAAIGAARDDDTRRRARLLFADALETRGGLKVQTLHSFAGALLSAFPIEARVAPGFATLDDRSALQIRADILAERAIRAATTGDRRFLDDLAALSIRTGENGVHDVIARLLASREAFERSYGSPLDWRGAVRTAIGQPPEGETADIIAAALGDDVFDWATVRDYAAAMQAWGSKTGLGIAATLGQILAANPAARAGLCDAFLSTGLTKLRAPKAAPKGLDDLHGLFCARLSALNDMVNGLAVADCAALHLRVGQAIAEDYDAAKHRAGVLDYDDLIVRASRLLGDFDAAYVLYKLDQRIDHVLVDEGQDTNSGQWAIINAITDEFFAGAGARDADLPPRTQFAVGDYKQAIFGFQGTNPEEFERARQWAAGRAKAAGMSFDTVDLSLSFRSVPAVLDVVDQLVMNVGAGAFGVSGTIPVHRVHREDGAGEVVLWPPVAGSDESAGADDDADGENDAPGVLKDNERLLASRIAAEIDGWLKRGDSLASKGRPIEAGDILILVRARGELVPALVSALHAAKVPVAGADRLRLTSPIAVKDVLALARFALQPGDDLTLAALLVSPFIGWTQERLYTLAYKRPATLWRALRDAAARGEADAAAAEAWLGDVLKRADFTAPYEFFEGILSGRTEGRARLLARLGEEARDPVEEVLNQALAYEAANTPSLQGFLAWIDTDEVDVKRDPDAPLDAVRIMTVHGAKGLQAPIVILADAAKAVPKGARPPLMLSLDGVGSAPVYYGRKALLSGPAKAAHDKAARDESEEHMRLLYVAMTRAEDRLYVGGARGSRSLTAKSWHDHVADALTLLGAEPADEDRWGSVLRHASGTPAAMPTKPVATPDRLPELTFSLPDWARETAPAEARPPRPLAPSALAEDDVAQPPPSAAMQAAARRGQILHMLFERLGAVPAETRAAAIAGWLRRNAPEQDAGAVVAEVLAVMNDPSLAAYFTGDVLSEAPLSAVVGDRLIAGTVDKLIIGDDLVGALDFKTGLNVPTGADTVPPYHRRQMAAYRDALATIFPGRRIETALLYTAGPTLIRLDD